jgi:transcriptional regulator with XRE-family HTH domain
MKSLKELREQNNLKQREVAQHIGVSDRVYSYYEKGRTLPAKYVKPLANLFGISCDELLENNTEALDWEKEFGNIVRTERLVLPTWEDFWNSGQTIWFTGKDGGQYGLSQYNREILLNDTYIGYLDKESYYNACRKCKDIFLGEKK